MRFPSVLQAYSSPQSTYTQPASSPSRSKPSVNNEPPSRKPDWLLIMIGILVLLTLLIAWLAGVPLLGR